MDGLECTEVTLSTALKYQAFRIDSHFYEKKYQELCKKFNKFKCCTLKDIVSKPIQTGHTPSMAVEAYYGGSIPLIKTDNLHENSISCAFTHYLTPSGNEVISRTTLEQDDIITTIIGATEDIIARSAMVAKEHLPANINQNIAQIRVDSRKMLPAYVNAYLNSSYGKQYLLYLSRQTEQVNLNCKEVESVLIPVFSNDFQKIITDITTKAHSLNLSATAAYNAGQELLHKSIPVENNAYMDRSHVIKSLKNSFAKTGRIDAEYYQQKYERYTRILHTTESVATLCCLHDTTFVPDVNGCYGYIELSNVGNAGDISGVEYICGADLPTRARRMVKQGQIVVSSVEGSLQSCALVTKEYDGCLCSTGFYVLDSDDINPETLLVLFKSEIIQALMKQRCSGTILAGISKDELLKMPFPKIESSLQEQIAIMVQNSFDLRDQARTMLMLANQAVETAIEHGEDYAMAWLKDKV